MISEKCRALDKSNNSECGERLLCVYVCDYEKMSVKTSQNTVERYNLSVGSINS